MIRARVRSAQAFVQIAAIANIFFWRRHRIHSRLVVCKSAGRGAGSRNNHACTIHTASYGVAVDDQRLLSLAAPRLASWCSLSLGGWWPRNPARRMPTCSGRLGGAAAAGRTMVMSPAAPDSFSVIFRFGADAGARAIGATDDYDDVGFGEWRRRVAQRGSATYGVIDSDRQILQH
jgi:hypothetical protein